MNDKPTNYCMPRGAHRGIITESLYSCTTHNNLVLCKGVAGSHSNQAAETSLSKLVTQEASLYPELFKLLSYLSSSRDILDCIHSTMCSNIPYSGKVSREKIFANFANYRQFAKIFSANVLFSVDKDRAIALIRENIIREMLYLAHSRKFSPTKIRRRHRHRGGTCPPKFILKPHPQPTCSLARECP